MSFKFDTAKKFFRVLFDSEFICLFSKWHEIQAFSENRAPWPTITAAWPTINDLAGRKSKPSIRIKGESAEKRKESRLSYFLNLLGGQPPNTLGNRALPLVQIAKLLDISTSTFTIQELEDAIKSLRGNKAPGLDNIPSLIWKDPLFHALLLRFCNHTFSSLRPPSAWTKSGIVPIPKKGDLTLPLNYRGISLIPIAAKIYNKLLLNRLVPAVDPLLCNNQNGFRGGRSTITDISPTPDDRRNEKARQGLHDLLCRL